MPPVSTGSAGLNVSCLDVSIQFYRATLGFDVVRRSADSARPWAHLGVNGTVLLTLWQQAGHRFDAAWAGLHHLSFEVPDVGALREVEARIRAAGVRLRGDGGGPATTTGQLFFLDPDGIRIEVYADNGPPVDWNVPPACGFYDVS